MLDLIVLNNCASGTCPQAQQIVSTSYVLAPQVVAVASVVPGKTTVQYKRNIFGRLVPVHATVTTKVSTVEAQSSEAKTAKGGTCKGGCKN